MPKNCHLFGKMPKLLNKVKMNLTRSDLHIFTFYIVNLLKVNLCGFFSLNNGLGTKHSDMFYVTNFYNRRQRFLNYDYDFFAAFKSSQTILLGAKKVKVLNEAFYI